MIGLCNWGISFDTMSPAPNQNLMPKMIKISLFIAGIGGCFGILGIRTSVMIFRNLRSHSTSLSTEQEETITDKDAKFGVQSYRYFIGAGGFYVLTWGLFFIALIEFMQVITIDLSYPTINQVLLLILEIWLYLCFIFPGSLSIIDAIWLKLDPSLKYRKIHRSLNSLSGILALFSIFGLSVGIKTLLNRDLLQGEIA
jgi:hypothetical protein